MQSNNNDDKSPIRKNTNLICKSNLEENSFEIDKENIDSLNMKPNNNNINEENEYFEKRSHKQKLFIQLEKENYIHEEEFDKIRNRFDLLEMSKTSILMEINSKNTYLKSLEEKNQEKILKINKTQQHTENIEKKILELNIEKKSITEQIEELDEKKKDIKGKINKTCKTV